MVAHSSYFVYRPHIFFSSQATAAAPGDHAPQAKNIELEEKVASLLRELNSTKVGIITQGALKLVLITCLPVTIDIKIRLGLLDIHKLDMLFQM